MSTFFQAVGIGIDHIAESLAEDIVHAFKAGGAEAVRLLVCRHVAQHLQVSLHIHPWDTPGRQVEVFKPQQMQPQQYQQQSEHKEQPPAVDAGHVTNSLTAEGGNGGAAGATNTSSPQAASKPLHLARNAQELYSLVSADGSSLPSSNANGMASSAAGAAGADHTPAATGGGVPATPSKRLAADSSGGAKVVRAWEDRYADLHAFVQAHGQRPKRLAEEHERQLMMLQHRNIKEGKLSAERAALILPILAIKTVKRPSGGSAGKAVKRQRTQQHHQQQQLDETDDEEHDATPWQQDGDLKQDEDAL